ncbi:STAS-like domain-containing protein [Yoonia sp.]|uniref:STAS-like domain-containing protein n=1 Tax=Yoonia sp. TaxID=2212373 RepID=UPI003F6D712E
MVMSVKNLVNGCDTNDQGIVIYKHVSSCFKAGTKVTLDFSGISNVTSSFVNSSFVQLIDDFGYDHVRSLLVIKGVNNQIGSLLRERMSKIAA